jgi:hypothetical protein
MEKKKKKTTLSIMQGKKMKVDKNNQLPWDLLDVIARKLNFDDLFQFGSVCKNWWEFHKFYWRNFMASQEPLILQKSLNFEKSFFFHSVHDQKIYHSNISIATSDLSIKGLLADI